MSKRELVEMPAVSPQVTDPRAARYRNALDARKGVPPVAGGPQPPIPKLTGDLPDGSPVPMSSHALRERKGIAVGSMAGQNIMRDSAPPSAPSSKLAPMDILPPQAKEDPAYREGTGAMYAVNQPHLAMKYGVLRGNTHVPPQALFSDPTQRQPNPDTVKSLEEVLKFQQVRKEAETGEMQAAKDADKGSAAVAARVGNALGDDSHKPLTPQERKELNEAVARKVDDFDFDTFRQMMMKDLLNNDEQKTIIEDRLKPLDISDLIMQGFVTQEVVIIPGKFWVVFRSVSGRDDLQIKRMLMEEARTIQVDDRYYLDKFAFMVLTLALDSVNGNPLPAYRDPGSGEFNLDMFWRKYEYISRLNIHMIASLAVNNFWFDIRVRKLFVAEKVKNG